MLKMSHSAIFHEPVLDANPTKHNLKNKIYRASALTVNKDKNGFICSVCFFLYFSLFPFSLYTGAWETPGRSRKTPFLLPLFSPHPYSGTFTTGRAPDVLFFSLRFTIKQIKRSLRLDDVFTENCPKNYFSENQRLTLDMTHHALSQLKWASLQFQRAKIRLYEPEVEIAASLMNIRDLGRIPYLYK